MENNTHIQNPSKKVEIENEAKKMKLNQFNGMYNEKERVDFEDAIPTFEVKTKPDKYPPIENGINGYQNPQMTGNQDGYSNIQPEVCRV